MNRTPIEDTEADALFRELADAGGIGLAVSGGADSMALMYLAAAWRSRLAVGPKIRVLTVDHGLRPGSAEEARFVCDAAARLELMAYGLVWKGAKPASGVQAAARDARYRLLIEHAMRHELCALVTAHTADDQAETLLMRLGRGSGLDGLAAMAPRVRCRGCDIVRPLLGVPRARLVATLQRLGASWIEDPSNCNERYERTRLRAIRPALDSANLRIDTLARSAARLRRAREAIEAAVDAAMAVHAVAHDAGFCTVAARALIESPAEIALRMIARTVDAAGGRNEPVRLSRLETFLDRLRSGAFRGETLGRCVLRRKGTQLLALREIGRAACPAVVVEPGGRALWDGRFRVALTDAAQKSVIVRALSVREGRDFKAKHSRSAGLPAAALSAVPSFWSEQTLIAVPSLGFGSRDCQATFCGFGAPAQNSTRFGHFCSPYPWQD